MRAMWKGAISFGLVSIAVKVHAATEEKAVRFRQVHRDDNGRISVRRFCDDCGDEVAYEDVAKAYELDDGRLVAISDEELAGLPLPTLRTIEVLRFVRTEEVDPVLYHRTYFLEPDDIAVLPYTLLRDALRDSRRVAIAKVALRQVERLAAIRVRDDMLLLHTMMWPDELRAPEFSFLDAPVAVPAPELARTTSLIDAMTERFDADGLRDDFRAALLALIATKAGDTPVDSAATTDVPASRAVRRRGRAEKAA
ncbi:Ku protein [Micromonospora eburnea]|uniref:Non-homologous end joining protein Ku n=1 Tax=Micromonospora eburnea TaxID=227316 RepID=A0A1C6UUA7_9ACTN|nr:Ku protein [Micromonospora eburnea]SCL57627.1 DNA end-binding protein Ku [Micromonospora eburnea]